VNSIVAHRGPSPDETSLRRSVAVLLAEIQSRPGVRVPPISRPLTDAEREWADARLREIRADLAPKEFDVPVADAFVDFFMAFERIPFEVAERVVRVYWDAVAEFPEWATLAVLREFRTGVIQHDGHRAPSAAQVAQALRARVAPLRAEAFALERLLAARPVDEIRGEVRAVAPAPAPVLPLRRDPAKASGAEATPRSPVVFVPRDDERFPDLAARWSAEAGKVIPDDGEGWLFPSRWVV
jgi:hypothetical protein